MDKIEFFKSLGFLEYESKTLSSLMKLNISNPKEISQDSGVPQNKLYQILRKFENLGILSSLPNKKYKLINLKTFINSELAKKESQLKQLKQSSKKLEQIKEPENEFSFSLIKGQIPTMNKIAEVNQGVKKEIIGVQRNWKIWGRGLRDMQNSVNRGVKIRLIGVVDRETKKRAEEWKKIGCKIKVYNQKFGENPLRFTIFDNNEARITLGKPEIPDTKDYITIWTKSKPLINLLRKQFFDMWKESKSF